MFRVIVWLTWSLAVGTALAAEHAFKFGHEMVGQTPPGFRSAVTGEGRPGDWQVVLDEVPSIFAPSSPKSVMSNKRAVLAQVSRDKTDNRYPILIYEGESFDDFTLTTRFKIVEGELEQMAGVAFRIQDEKNYYYIRASALGANLSFARMINGGLAPGQRIETKVDIPKGVWQELTVECRGNRVRGLLNGKELLLVTVTGGLGAFSNGKIGFWTMADSVSYFTDTRVNYRPREIFAETLVRETLAKTRRLLGLKIYAATNELAGPQVIASDDPAEVGQPGPKSARETIGRGAIFYNKERGRVMVTLPLHDRNGYPRAAVRVVMKPVLGQTEKNALARALPIVRDMESRSVLVDDLTQ